MNDYWWINFIHLNQWPDKFSLEPKKFCLKSVKSLKKREVYPAYLAFYFGKIKSFCSFAMQKKTF